MIEQEATIDRPDEKKNKTIKRIFLFFVVFLFGILFLSSCTKAFTSDSDKANLIYVQMYGQDSSDESNYDESTKTLTQKGDFSKKGTNYLQSLANGTYSQNIAAIAVPNQKFLDYISIGYTVDFTTSVPTINPIKLDNNASLTDGLSKPQAWLNENLLASNDEDAMSSIFGEEIYHAVRKAEKRDGDGWTSLDFSSKDDIEYFVSCFQSAKAVSVFGGYVDGKVTLWGNMDTWFVSCRDEIGIENAPSDGFVTYYKTIMNNAISNNRAGLNTSGTGGMYGQEGNKVYITSKTWGEAFSEYGFLEGLLVWPIGWLTNSLVELFGAGTGWAELGAIALVTIIVRLILVVFSIFTSRSQSKMTELQGEISEIQAKYPNAKMDVNEAKMMRMETNALYKKNGVKPWLMWVQLIIQFPLFICVWAALQGAATLSSGNFFGIDLTESMSSVILNSSGSVGTGARVLATIMLIIMFLAQFFSMMTSQWFNKWKTNKFVKKKPIPTSDNAVDPNKMTKYMTIIMMVFMIFMGISLPAGMSMYWFFGALITIVQVFITEAIASHDRHKKNIGGSNGTDASLAEMRRSKHHQSIRSSR